jgi:ankyrin repeat protein
MVHKFLILALAVMVIGLADPANAQSGAFADVQAAVRGNNAKLVQELLARGIDPDTTDREGTTLLMAAAGAGYIDVARVLIGGKAKVNARNQFGESALMVAAIRGHRTMVEFLIQHGADVNPPGWTPLMFAAVKGHVDIVKLLLAKGARVNAASENGTTALMLAAREASLDTVLVLIELGAAVNLRNLAGATALGMALDGKRQDVVSALLRAGAEQ